jgi:hypothetical protein
MWKLMIILTAVGPVIKTPQYAVSSIAGAVLRAGGGRGPVVESGAGAGEHPEQQGEASHPHHGLPRLQPGLMNQQC